MSNNRRGFIGSLLGLFSSLPTTEKDFNVCPLGHKQRYEFVLAELKPFNAKSPFIDFYNGTPGEPDSHIIDFLYVCKVCGIVYVPRKRSGDEMR